MLEPEERGASERRMKEINAAYSVLNTSASEGI